MYGSTARRLLSYLRKFNLAKISFFYFTNVEKKMVYSKKNRAQKRRKTRRSKKQQIGGVQRPIVLDGVSYQGADAFIINRWTDGKDYVILFEQISRDGRPYFQLPGGRCEDTHPGLENTINQELWEESKKSVSVSVPLFVAMTSVRSFVEYDGDSVNPGRRRCFVCRAPYVSKTFYDENATILNNLTSPDNNAARGKPAGYHRNMLHSFLETKSMKRVLLSSLNASYFEKMQQYGTDNGKSRMIDGVWVNSYVIKAYIEAVSRGLIEGAFYLDPSMHKQTPNGNNFRNRVINMTGKCDNYDM